MKVILVPGFWFDASSWDAVTPLLQQSGHDVTALTLPGLASVDIDRSDIGLAEHVAAVVEQVDAAGEPVVLVGSSFAGKLVQIVTDERPESVALAVYVDSLPKPVDAEAADEPAGADIAFSWDELTPDEQRDLTPDQRSTIERTAVPTPPGSSVTAGSWPTTAATPSAASWSPLVSRPPTSSSGEPTTRASAMSSTPTPT